MDRWTSFWGTPRLAPRLENIGIKITIPKCMVLLYPIIAAIVHGFIYSSNGCNTFIREGFHMKTNCNLRASLHNLISSTPNSNSTTSSGKISRSATSRAKSYGTMRDRQTSNKSTDYPDITAVSCTGNCSSCCCAVLILRFVADCCDDPGALAEDARCLLKKYPLD